MQTPRSKAAALSREVARAVRESRAELASMPFFVRPMVKRGFRKRTGRSIQDWEARLAAVASTLESGDATPRDLIADLERLRENFRTAPERAKRGMGDNPAALAEVRARSGRRESLVGDLIAALSALDN
jgi:hypothetical protein